MQQIKYGSVCSGIEAASCAWHPLGWRADWFAEIEPFPSAVLAHRWPGVKNLGDMTLLAAQVLAGTISAPDVLVGGTPCQAFSVAGMRKGLLDPRGALTIRYVELADAIDHVRTRDGRDECITVWENVPGVLSDKGNAFGCFLGALVGESDALQPAGGKWTDAGCVYGPKRSAAWRVLDAQYFGLAQRRRRVFVVSSARAGFDPAAVLLEFEGVRRDSPPSREAGQSTTPGIGGGADGGCGQPGREANRRPAAKAFGGGKHCNETDVSTALTAHPGGRYDLECETFVVAGTLQAGGKTAGSATLQDAESGLLITFNSNAQVDHMRFDPRLSAPLTCSQNSAVCVTGEITHTLKAEGFDASEDGPGRGQPMVPCGSAVRRLTPRECERLQGFADDYTLIPWDGWRKLDAGETPEQCIADGMKVRQAKKSKAWYVCDADGQRYKAIGNSKAVPVVRWIGRRIQLQM